MTIAEENAVDGAEGDVVEPLGLVALGFGVGAGNWLSLVICAVVPPLGLLSRIMVGWAARLPTG